MKQRILTSMVGLMLLIGLPLGSTAANTKKKIAQVTEAVTISDNWDYTVTGDEPFADGGSIDIVNTEHAVVILEKVKPSAAIKLLAKYVTINGAKAVNNNNCQVKIYNCGAIILPYPDKQMLTVYSEPDFGGTSVNSFTTKNTGGYMNTLKDAELNNKIRSFKLKRGFDHVEAAMHLYDENRQVKVVNIIMDGELVYVGKEPHLLIQITK